VPRADLHWNFPHHITPSTSVTDRKETRHPCERTVVSGAHDCARLLGSVRGHARALGSLSQGHALPSHVGQLGAGGWALVLLAHAAIVDPVKSGRGSPSHLSFFRLTCRVAVFATQVEERGDVSIRRSSLNRHLRQSKYANDDENESSSAWGERQLVGEQSCPANVSHGSTEAVSPAAQSGQKHR